MKSLANILVTISTPLTPSRCVGRTRYDRLLHIGKHSKVLSVDALKAAVREAKKGDDVGRYKDACQYLQFVAPHEQEAQFDDEWAKSKEDQNRKETARLENELKGYKNNLIKESIRVSRRR